MPFFSKRLNCVLTQLVLLVGLLTAARAQQWTLSVLHPAGAKTSFLYGGAAGKQVGAITIASGPTHAGIWSGSPGSFVDLDPAGTFLSYVFATNGTELGGSLATAGAWEHAVLWPGTPQSFVDLHPAGYARSSIVAMSATQQGGYADSTLGTSHAALWTSTAASFVDLHPSGYIGSQITAMASSQQGGYGRLNGGGGRRALLWNGSASSAVYLHAQGIAALSDSAIYAMTETQQGGVASPQGGTEREQAALWSGTASTWVSLHPAGATSSRVLAMAGPYQAGQVNDQAAVWQGSASSWVNLHTGLVAQLGANYTRSIVRGAYQTADGVVLVGSATDIANNVTIAVMWGTSIPSVAPSIIGHPRSKTIGAGSAVTFSVDASGTAPLHYQWRKNGSPIAGGSSATLTLSGLVASDSGSYDVVVSNVAGSATSSPADLNVLPASSGSTRHVVNLGSAVDLSVDFEATGATSYQWFHNFDPIPGATSAVYSLTNATMQANGHYELEITDDSGVRRSVPLFVIVAPAAVEVVVWGAQNQSSVPVGLTDVVAVASGPWHSLALKRDGTVVAWGENFYGQTNVPAGLTDVVAISTGNSFSMALKADGTIVQWGIHSISSLAPVPVGTSPYVMISAGEGRAAALRLDGTGVAWGDANAGGATYVLAQGGFKSVAVGSSHTVALKQNGTVVVNDGAVNMTTPLNSVPVGLVDVVAIAASSRNVLVLKSDGGLVAWGENDWGVNNIPTGLQDIVQIDLSRSNAFALRADGSLFIWGDHNGSGLRAPTDAVNLVMIDVGGGGDNVVALRKPGLQMSPEFTAQPRDWTSDVNSSVGFRTVVTAVPAPSYQWQRLPAGESAWVTLSDGGNYSGTTTDVLEVKPVLFAMKGDQFRCIASNALGSATSRAATLSVRTPLPVITTQPEGRFMLPGPSVTLSVSVVSPVPVTYQWRKSEVPISGAVFASYSIASVQLDDAASYDVVVTNSVGSVTSYDAVITVITKPVITSQPTSRTAQVGASLSLSVVATSNVPSYYESLTYAWYRNGESIAGATNPSLTINSVQPGDAGSYFVVVSNSAGPTYSDSVLVTVEGIPPPVITSQPQSQVVATGGGGSFSVTATGATQFQWRFNGNDLPLATSSVLSLTNVVSSHAGGYSVAVSNSGGTVVSNVATLTVSPIGFAAYQQSRFNQPELADAGISGPNADPDGDGLVNLMEYALGLEPKVADTNGLPEVYASATEWTYTYTRPSDRSDLVYTVEVSTDLTAWTSASVTHERVSVSPGRETWRAQRAAVGAPNLFFRLKINLQ